MDGNGRWAKKRALNRLKGHKAGIEAVRETIRCASRFGGTLPYHLLVFHRELEAAPGRSGGADGPVCQDHAGGGGRAARGERAGAAPSAICPFCPRKRAWPSTRRGRRRATTPGMTLVVAVNYGARDEMMRAVNACAKRAVLKAEETRHCARDNRGNVRARASTPPTFPTRRWLSAPAARCASPTSCCGRRPMPSSW